MGWNLAALKALGSPIDYDIANESFEAYVPSAYTGIEPYGLLVWINAGPDVFRGGCYIIGCNYFRNVDVNPATHEIYSATFTKPVPVLFALARDRSRHVLLTGETDMNRLQTKLNADAMAKDGFRHVTYLEQPGLGHSAPNAEWFEKGIVALDEPLATEPEAPATAASK